MGSITEVDYLAQSRSRYTQQFKNKPIFDAHLKIFITEVLELQEMLQDLIGLRGLETATGTQLDVIGAIIGQPRVLINFTLFPFFGTYEEASALSFGDLAAPSVGGVMRSLSESIGTDYKIDDDTYRFILRARIAANISDTTPQGVINAVNYITGRTDSSLEEIGNANIRIIHYAILTPLQEYFLRGMSSIGSIVPLPIGVFWANIDKNADKLLVESGALMIEESGDPILGE